MSVYTYILLSNNTSRCIILSDSREVSFVMIAINWLWNFWGNVILEIVFAKSLKQNPISLYDWSVITQNKLPSDSDGSVYNKNKSRSLNQQSLPFCLFFNFYKIVKYRLLYVRAWQVIYGRDSSDLLLNSAKSTLRLAEESTNEAIRDWHT